jgi:hypothetical protein
MIRQCGDRFVMRKKVYIQSEDGSLLGNDVVILLDG